MGKVEAGIPEDDPRNAAVVADLVGDNVGDCAGRGADLFESTAAENIGAMILGVAVWRIATELGWPHPEAWIFFPLVVRGFGLLATIVAMFFIRGREDENPMNILNRGYWATTLLSVAALALVTWQMMQTVGTTGANGIPSWIWFFGAGVVGLATSVAFVYITQYYTAGSFRPVREIAEASKTGPATNIISGTAVGFETTAVTAITISIALFASYLLGEQALAGIEGVEAGVGGIFGTAVATMGMLMTTAYILAMDTFGPITDNAGGIAQFSNAEAGAREITDRLDAVGNTTKALTKGYAIASASLAAFLLFSAYIDKVNLILQRPDRRRAAGGGNAARVRGPRQRQRVHRRPHRRDARLLLQQPRDPRRRHRRPGDHRRGPAPVPRDAGDHGLHPAPGLRARGRHHDPRGAAADDPARVPLPSPRRSSSACCSATRPWPAC